MKNVKRVAGASAGAIIATLISLGFDSEELKDFLDQDLRLILVGEQICALDMHSNGTQGILFPDQMGLA